MRPGTKSRIRHEEILTRLRELFLAEGFASLSIGDLAERLRCSRTTLYGLAPSKEQLVVTVVRSYFKGAAERIEADVARSDDPRERLARYLSAVAAELEPVSAEFFADVAEFGPANGLYQENTRYAAARIQTLVNDGVKAGALRPVDASFVGAAVAQIMGGIQRGEVQAITGLDSADAYRHLADLIVNSVVDPRP
jgi:AcrR family transcriptional regulator